MPKLTWDETGERFYETGVDHGVLYVYNTTGGTSGPGAGVPWNGLSSISESPDGAEATDIYADNIKYISLRSTENFKGTIEAYTYPDEFEECDGSRAPVPGLQISQQARKTFGFSYRSRIGNDTDGDEKGYKLHLIYGASVSPSEKQYQTVNDSPEAITFSWEFDTVPVAIPGYRASARVIVDSINSDPGRLAALEAVLYGIDTTDIAAFDTSKTYNVGDMVSKTETVSDESVTKYYYCKTKITIAGEWDATKWVELDDGGPRLPMPSEVITILTPDNTNAA